MTPTIYQKIAFSILPIPNIGNFKIFIYKNAFSRPPLPKVVNFKTFYTKIYFRNPQYQKWHFWDSWYKKCIFETPPHKNRDPHTFFMFFSPNTKWPLIQIGQNLPLSSYIKGQNMVNNSQNIVKWSDFWCATQKWPICDLIYKNHRNLTLSGHHIPKNNIFKTPIPKYGIF